MLQLLVKDRSKIFSGVGNDMHKEMLGELRRGTM